MFCKKNPRITSKDRQTTSADSHGTEPAGSEPNAENDDAGSDYELGFDGELIFDDSSVAVIADFECNHCGAKMPLDQESKCTSCFGRFVKSETNKRGKTPQVSSRRGMARSERV